MCVVFSCRRRAAPSAGLALLRVKNADRGNRVRPAAAGAIPDRDPAPFIQPECSLGSGRRLRGRTATHPGRRRRSLVLLEGRNGSSPVIASGVKRCPGGGKGDGGE